MPYGANVFTHTTATVISTGVVTVLAANANRRSAMFFNMSTSATVWLGLSTGTVTVSNGIALNPATVSSGHGDSFTMSIGQGNLTRGAITAIANSSAAALIVVEGV